MTPQQRANWALLQSVLDEEYGRGFKRGLEVGQAWNEVEAAKRAADDVPEAVQSGLFMHTRPYDPEECENDPKKGLDFPPPVL